MRIETKYLCIELEPELVTDEHLARIQKLVALATEYEKSRRKAAVKGDAGEAEPEGKRRNRSGQ